MKKIIFVITLAFVTTFTGSANAALVCENLLGSANFDTSGEKALNDALKNYQELRGKDLIPHEFASHGAIKSIPALFYLLQRIQPGRIISGEIFDIRKYYDDFRDKSDYDYSRIRVGYPEFMSNGLAHDHGVWVARPDICVIAMSVLAVDGFWKGRWQTTYIRIDEVPPELMKVITDINIKMDPSELE